MPDEPPVNAAPTGSFPAEVVLPSPALIRAANGFAASKNTHTVLFSIDGKEAFVYVRGNWFSVTMQKFRRD